MEEPRDGTAAKRAHAESLCGSDIRAAPEHSSATQAVSNTPHLQAGPRDFLSLSKSET